jgi:predicted permease
MAPPLRQAFRRLAKSPGFTIVSTLMLALGIAISTAAFSVANDLLLRPMPFHHPDELVRVFTTSRNLPAQSLSPGIALDIRDELGDIGEFGLFMPRNHNVAEPGRSPEQQFGLAATPNVLKLLGVQPALGRDFTPQDGNTNAPEVVLLTDRFWRDHFAADPAVIGKILRIDGADTTIIGVLPPVFDETLLWYRCAFVSSLTVWPDWRDQRTNKWMELMGRLRPGVTLTAAQVRLNALAARLAHDHPDKFGTDGLQVTPLGSSYAGASMRTLCWLVVGLAALVLVIACANLGGLQLSRALGRSGELAIRAALGATQRHLIPALALEGTVVAVAGTILGSLGTFWSRNLLGHWFVGPPVTIDWRVLAFAALAGIFATIGFSFAPSWLLARSTMMDAMKDASRGSTLGRSQHRLKFALIAGQVGLALVLLSAAAANVFGVRAFLHRERGWRPDGLVAGAIQVPWASRVKDDENPVLVRTLRAKLGALPGVQRVTVAADVTIYGGQDFQPVILENAEPVPAGREPRALVSGVDSAFFSTLGIALRQGRLFPPEWRATDPAVVVIGATTARLLWPGENAIGKRLRLGDDKGWHEVIGIVGDASFNPGFDSPATKLQIYRPLQEIAKPPWLSFVLESSLPAGTLEHSMRQVITTIDPDLMVTQVGDVSRKLASFVRSPLIPVLMTFAAAGLAIAMIGLYATMNQFVLQRRRDIGVRMALGADYHRVIRLMLAQGARFLAVGITIGAAGACAVGMVLHKTMPEMPPLEAGSQLLIASSLGIAGLAACYLPSRRAALVNPVEVLRAE